MEVIAALVAICLLIAAFSLLISWNREHSTTGAVVSGSTHREQETEGLETAL
jgi:hypothetical protein